MGEELKYLEALLEKPILDVRSESEFKKGNLPGSINIPILNDVERHQVGLCYKQNGSEAAVKLGHQLVSGGTRNHRVQEWISVVKEQKIENVVCWRGGMRSEIAQGWIAEAGVEVGRVEGGYKRIRNQLLRVLESVPAELDITVLAGRTGSGKTEFLHQYSGGLSVIDLEGLAAHRGSVFGGLFKEQPGVASFENLLAADLLKLKTTESKRVLVEDESLMIGRLAIPKPFFERMNTARVVVLEEPLEARADRIVRDYVFPLFDLFETTEVREKLLGCVHRIRKRLGGLKRKHVDQLISDSLNDSETTKDTKVHLEWVSFLLSEYYDPQYDYHMDQNEARVAFRGDRESVLRELCG